MEQTISKTTVKNFKKAYVASTVIIYFSDDDLNTFTYLHKTIRENTKFIKIGSHIKNEFDKVYRSRNKFNKFEEASFSWDADKKDNHGNFEILSARAFFKENFSRLDKILSQADLALVVYKNQNVKILEYVNFLINILNKNEIFAFHFVVESLITSSAAKKLSQKNWKKTEKYCQPIVRIDEGGIIQTYKFSNIVNRSKYTAKFINSIAESFLVPFLEPELNTNYYSLIKRKFYSDRKNFKISIIPTLGYSDSKQDWLDKALVSALTNSMFRSAYKATKDFLIILKTSYLTDKMIKRIEYVFKSIVGKDVNIIFSKYIGDFVLDVYAQINIFALGVDVSYLSHSDYNSATEMKKILEKVEKSKRLFDNTATKTVLINLPFNKIYE